MPLYFRLLTPAGAWEILAHRMLWSLALCLALLAVSRQVGGVLRYLARPRRLAGVAAAGLLIAINWVVYLTAVTTGHVTEAALGYFLNPLVSVALGLLFLGERLRPAQSAAVAIGAAGGVFLAVAGGRIPWIALVLAFSFGTYGLVKNRLGVTLTALAGLTAETAVLAPVAVAILLWQSAVGATTFASQGPGHAALLASTGVVTALPLLLFAAAARRIPLVTIGLLQFVAPVLQFIAGLWLGEPMTGGRWAGFAVVWLALAVLVADSLHHVRRRPTAQPPAAL